MPAGTVPSAGESDVARLPSAVVDIERSCPRSLRSWMEPDRNGATCAVRQAAATALAGKGKVSADGDAADAHVVEPHSSL